MGLRGLAVVGGRRTPAEACDTCDLDGARRGGLGFGGSRSWEGLRRKGEGERSPARVAPCSEPERRSERGEKVPKPQRGRGGGLGKEWSPLLSQPGSEGSPSRVPSPPGWAHTHRRDLWALPPAPAVPGLSHPTAPAAPLPHGRLPLPPSGMVWGEGERGAQASGPGKGSGGSRGGMQGSGTRKGAPGATWSCGQLPTLPPQIYRKVRPNGQTRGQPGQRERGGAAQGGSWAHGEGQGPAWGLSMGCVGEPPLPALGGCSWGPAGRGQPLGPGS